jgi:hypothetical protein
LKMNDPLGRLISFDVTECDSFALALG